MRSVGDAGPAAGAVARVREAVAAATDALTAARCESPRLDADLLIADAIGLDRGALVAEPGRPVPAAATRRAMESIRRRTRREPVAYILGRRGFRHIELAVDPRVMIPRPETELLVEVALERVPRGGRVHEVGTGCGAVALALKQERPDLLVSASDASAAAVEVARANADRLALDVDISAARDLPAEQRSDAPDLVVANLPYVREDEWPALQPEITGYEPREALVGGRDGLDAIRALVATAPRGTQIALEHAPAQEGAVRSLLAGAVSRADLGGRPRVTAGRVP